MAVYLSKFWLQLFFLRRYILWINQIIKKYCQQRDRSHLFAGFKWLFIQE